MSDAKTLAALKRFQARREDLFARATAICDASKALTAQNFRAFETRLQRLEHLEISFADIQKEIVNYNFALSDASQRIDVEKASVAFDEVIDTARANYFTLLNAATPPNAGTSSPANVSGSPLCAASSQAGHKNLPKILLPTFNGKIENWDNFKTLFDSLVHNNANLTLNEKFYYLRAHVTDDPLAIVNNYTLEAKNYVLAYQDLVNRYSSPRRLASYYFGQLYKFSSDNFSLRRFVTVHTAAISALKLLNIPDLADYVFFQLAYLNLDNKTRFAFDNEYKSTDVPSTKQLFDFVQYRLQTEELRADQRDQQSQKEFGKKTNAKVYTTALPDSKLNPTAPSFSPVEKSSHTAPRNQKALSSKAELPPCPFCQAQHKLFQCDPFKAKPYAEKYEFVKTQKFCFGCLGNHAREFCNSTSACKTCQSRRHHTFLHPESEQQSVKLNVENPRSCVTNYKVPNVLLGTVSVLIKDKFGRFHKIRGLLDQCSQISAISLDAVNRLHLDFSKSELEISGISSASAKSRGTLRCTFSSRLNPRDEYSVQAFVMNVIIDKLPSENIDDVFPQFSDLELADPEFFKPGPIDLLLGADIYYDLLPDDKVELFGKKPTAFQTKLGWVISGPVHDLASGKSRLSMLTLSPTLETILKKFWEIEDMEYGKEVRISEDDSQVESHFKKSVARDESGRYIVGLPFKPDASEVKSNYNTAMKNCLSLQRKLARDSKLKAEYDKFMSEYLELGHMSIAPVPAKYILPHHCVFREQSSSTKVRVVFNASAPDGSGVSLNDRLFSGPKLQADIVAILAAFRTYRVALTCDITKMYRQIWLQPEDRAFQHVFWQPPGAERIQEFQLNTVTYGLAPSAYQAQRVLRELVHDEGNTFPAASKAILNNTYMDDIITGAQSVKAAEELYDELTELLGRAGFSLHKWATSHSDVLGKIPSEVQEKPLEIDDDLATIRILGLKWSPKSDSFYYGVKPFQGVATKRAVLSYLARLFDPMGWLGPIIFWIKHFIQQLWITNSDWDDELPGDLLMQWRSFSSEMEEVEKVRIPRFIFDYEKSIQLIGFSDASEKGYAAVAYTRCESEGRVSISLLMSKSKVAPLKPRTIPKLELCGASLLAELIDFVKNEKLAEFDSIHAFSDSTIVLAWIRSDPKKYKPFVALRVERIQAATAEVKWNYVPSASNPADIASRGASATTLNAADVWWSGPAFLLRPVNEWGFIETALPPENELPERKKTEIVCAAKVRERPLRIRRFFIAVRLVVRLNLCKCARLSPAEVTSFMQGLVLGAQRRDFKEDVELLRKSKPASLRLIKLGPFLDSDGFLRVGGRLKESDLPFEQKHPLILSGHSMVAKIICGDYHIKNLHAGFRALQPIIQSRFWIIGLRETVRRSIYECRPCRILLGKPVQPLMGSLPPSRVKVSRPFASVGVDYAGPFSLKDSHLRKPRQYKAYLCLFVCFATKAVHLEVVTALSTEAFLAAFERMVSRRGLPREVFSDCGTNFVGAARELQEIRDGLLADQDRVLRAMQSRGIVWKFNPPSAPNFGGLWEAAVKSAKALFARTLGDRTLTYEEATTFFHRAEAILNSRPLILRADDPNEAVELLTPGHFLVGGQLFSPPEPDFDQGVTLKSRWNMLRQTLQSFWSRWRDEYLQTLITREKWSKASPNLELGKLVLMQGQQSSPLCWPIGKVIKLHPGKDGVVRVATVDVDGSEFVRPVNKLIVIS